MMQLLPRELMGIPKKQNGKWIQICKDTAERRKKVERKEKMDEG